MKISFFLAVTLLFSACLIGGCGGHSEATIEPEQVVETPEMSPEEQKKYDEEMSKSMGN